MWYGTTQQPGTTEMKRIASHHTRGVLDLFAQTHPTKRYANPITKGRSLFLFLDMPAKDNQTIKEI